MPRKLSHSQNFVKDHILVRKLLKKAAIAKGDTVLEIGTGTGNITKILSEFAGRVLSVEKDPHLTPIAQQNLKSCKNVEIVNEDFMKFELPDKTPYKVFANIPFNYTSDIIDKLLNSENPPTEAFLFVQKEAAQRYLGNPRETQMSLLLKPKFEFAIIHKFGRSDFEPKPGVDIVLLKIKSRKKPLISNEDYPIYRDFIIFSLNQWKPNIKSALRKIFSNLQLKIMSENIGFGLNVKPLDLGFEQWARVFEIFQKEVPAKKKQIVMGFEEEFRKRHSGQEKLHRRR